MAVDFLSAPAKYMIKRILENEDLERQALTWQQLGCKMGLNISEARIWCLMGTMDYDKYLAYQQGCQ